MLLDNLIKTHKFIKETYVKCVSNLKRIGVPVQDDCIIDVVLRQLPKTQACCYYKTDETNKMIFLLSFDEKLVEHIEDVEVVNNFENSMYHELIHTCPDAQNHNDIWLKWANLCDEKLNTKTKRFCEDNIYYNTTHNDVITYKCDECGHEYCTTIMFENDIFCEICGRKMK
jgi:hypothetical protein